MNIKEVKTLIQAMIEQKCNVTPMFWGRHGLGKSAGGHQAAKALGYKMLDIRLAQKEAIDIAGMLFTFEDKELGMSVTASHPPQWFADALKKGKVIIFFDEFNMARSETTNATFEIVLDRKLNNQKLPDDVFIMCAGNPEDERYQTTPMSESLRDRLMHIKVEGNVDNWLEWAGEEELNPHIVSFIRACPGMLWHQNKLDEKFPVEIRHSERSWERASRIMQLKVDEDLIAECLCGIVGQEIAMAFLKTIEKDNMPINVKEVFAWKKETADRLKKYKESMRQDLIAITCHDFVDYALKNKAEASKHIESVKKFINALDESMAQVVIQGTRAIGADGEKGTVGWAAEFMKDSEIHKKLLAVNEVVKEVKKAKAATEAAKTAR